MEKIRNKKNLKFIEKWDSLGLTIALVLKRINWVYNPDISCAIGELISMFS